MSTRLLGPKRQRALLGWHRTLAGTGPGDGRAPRRGPAARPGRALRPASALVPFAAPWRPAAVPAGVIAAWLMLALTRLVPAAPLHRAARLAEASLRELRGLPPGAVHALASGTDLAGVGGPILALVAGGPVLALSTACASPAPRAVPRAPGRQPGRATPLHPSDRLHPTQRSIPHDLSESSSTARSATATARASTPTRRTSRLGNDGIATASALAGDPARPAKRRASARWARSSSSTTAESMIR